MNELFRTIDISSFVLPGEVQGRFSHAIVPAEYGIPFVMLHLKGERQMQETLRMDLQKRVFLGEVPDEQLRDFAPAIAQHVSGVAYPMPRAAA